MKDVVVDASALLDAFALPDVRPRLVERLAAATWHAPQLLDVEVLHVLRRMRLRGAVSDGQSDVVVQLLEQARIHRYPHETLRRRIWGLRAAVTAHDGTYVALAEVLRVPLVTTDARLAGSNGHHAVVEAY